MDVNKQTYVMNKKGGTNEICSKLSVSSDKLNTHVYVNSLLNGDECSLLLKQDDILKQLNSDFVDFDLDYQIFSVSLGVFLPLTDCYFCKEEDICSNVKYIDSDEKCSKLKPISFNLNTNYLCIKNPAPNAKNCIETNKCTDIKFGGTNGKCSKLNSSEGKICIKDPSSNGCKETDLCQEVKYIYSRDLIDKKCPSLKVSDNSYMKCIKDSNGNGCVETKYKCEERETINNVNDELCNKLETNDFLKKV